MTAPGAQLPGLQEGQRCDRRHDVRVREHVGVDHVGAGLAIGSVRDEGAAAGPRLHDDVETGRAQPRNGVRHQSDPALAGSRLDGNGHSHVGQPKRRPTRGDERPRPWTRFTRTGRPDRLSVGAPCW